MAEDIGIELHDKIKRAFDARCGKDSTLSHIKRKIENGTATMEDTSVYARRLGENLRKSIESTTKPDDLPGEKMYYNIAQSILEPLLRNNYDDVNTICEEVQRALDAKKGIGLKPQKASFPEERVRAAVNGAVVKETAEHAIQVLGRTAENITGSFQTDYIKKNAEFRSKAGLNCYIERKDGFRCCDWCAGLAGRYRYPDEVPKDVYRRHDNCTCDVSYVSEKGRQNVHTHQWNWGKEKTQEYLRQLDAEKKAKRAEYKANGKKLQKVRFKPSDSAARRKRIEYAASLPKPMKLTKAEAIAKESEILAQRRLTYDRKRGIIIANHKMAATGQQPPDFSLYEVREDFEAVQAVKKMMVEELGILENSIDLSGIKNADVLKPFMNRWKRIQKETGMKLPAIRAMDVIYGDECCVANFRPTENVFYISSKFFNSKKALLDTIKKWANNNIMPTQCKSIAYIAEHEAAHIRYSDKFNNNADVISMHKGFMKSKFANSNDRNLSEFIADSIAWSKVSPANIPPKMQELVDYIKAEVKT